ncbi:MAG TPA: biotin/lipoyl-binding protein, partial [Pirellulales bacterium]
MSPTSESSESPAAVGGCVRKTPAAPTGEASSIPLGATTPFRRRRDLVAVQQTHARRLYWLVKDPLTRNYFRLTEEEYFLLERLDGRVDWHELAAQHQRRFPRTSLHLDDLKEFAAHATTSGLASLDRPQRGAELADRGDSQRRAAFWTRFANPFWIRLPGFSPDGFFTAIEPLFGWFFSWWCATLCGLLIASAFGLVVVQFNEVSARLPSFNEYFTIENVLWLGAVLFVTKIVHEIGHGLACKRFGGEVHEVGVILVMFMPCLFCDVSDSWMIVDKKRRAAIGAAGMYVELVMAAIATWLWWLSEPGLFNFLCLHVMIVGSATSLLLNANPLVRYDGYYILSDLLEVPNLRQKSGAALSGALGKLCLGVNRPEDGRDDEAAGLGFAAYAFASLVYRWTVTFSLLWVREKMFEPYRLEVIGRGFSLLILMGFLITPAMRFMRFLLKPPSGEKVNLMRLAITLLLLVGAGYAIVDLPTTQRVFAPTVIEPRGSRLVYATTPGVLAEVHVRPGDRVEEGTPLATLSNPELSAAIAEMLAELNQKKAEIDRRSRARLTDPSAGVTIPTLRQTVTDLEEQLAESQRELERLVIRAPSAGAFIPPPDVKPHAKSKMLPEWSGAPLSPRNIGCTLAAGVVVGSIGEPTAFETVL